MLVELTQHELEGLREAVVTKKRKKRKKRKKKVLPLYADNLNQQGGATWWSPSSKARAERRQVAFDEYEKEQELAKTTKRELQHQKKLLDEKYKEEKRVVRLREKEERD